MTEFYKKNDYLWQGSTTQGQLLAGEIRAISKNVAKVYLHERGIIPSHIRKKNWLTANQLLQPRINVQLIMNFFRQLAILIAAGMPILQCFDTLQYVQDNIALRLLLNQLKQDIESGHGLKDAFKKFPQYFDEITCQLVHIGEQTGRLDLLLKRIALYKEKSLRLKKQVIQALLYPGMVFVTAISVTAVMLIFVVPRFETLFKSLNKTLPIFTQTVIYFSAIIREHIAYCLCIPIGMFVFVYCYKRLLRFKQCIDLGMIQMPMLSNILQKFILARLMRNFATLFASGMAILDALTLLIPISHNYAYQCAVHKVRLNVVNGVQLHISLQKAALFPPLVIQMVKVGEESGTLEHMLTKLAELYEEEIDNWIANLSQLLEPLIMIVLGVLIGGLVIAMYLPIFKLGTVI